MILLEKEYKIFKYRWIILAVIMPIIICTEMFWLTLSPVASFAMNYYNVKSIGISMFATSYMIMFVLFTFPASFIIDKYGYRTSVIIGSLVTVIFGILRAVFASNFALALICQFFIAIGQPFLLNVSTKVPANWFPISERSTASGLLTMAQYLGFVFALILSPILIESGGIPNLFWIFAIIACICAVLSISFTKEKPKVPPGPENPKEELSLALMLKLFKNMNFIYVLIIVFISMGIFNTLLTLIENILSPRGITMDQSGIIGAVFVISGIIGAVVLPIISDKIHKRVPIFKIAITLLVFLYLGLTFINSFLILCIVSALAGFTIMGVAPIIFQHGAEVAYPAKEGTSLGLILLMGQISGTLFVFLFEVLSSTLNNITIPMLIIVFATALEIPFTLKMKESDLFK